MQNKTNRDDLVWYKKIILLSSQAITPDANDEHD